MSLIDDYKAISINKKGLVFITLFRTSNFFANGNIVVKIIGFPFRIFYLVFVQWILGIDVPDLTTVGKGFNVWHGQGLIIHPLCKIGDNVKVRHNTTIGQRKEDELPPVIGSNVDIGAHVIIIGNITVGDNCTIGAGTIITKNIPANSIVYGNPMVVKNKLNNEQSDSI